MKKILLFTLLASYTICAQTTDFAVENRRITWTHIYNTPTPIQDLASQLRTYFPHSTPQQVTDNTITGNTDYSDLITDKKGLNAFFKQPAKFNYTVQFKDDKYRVIINNIAFKSIEITIYNVTDTSDSLLDQSLVRNSDGELRKNAISQKVLQELHATFLERFTFKNDAGW